MAADDYAIRLWNERMAIIGVTIDPNLRENIAANIDNIDALKDIGEEAKQVAKAHEKADRGTQMHRVLQLVLLDLEWRLLTDQQRQDAEVLKRTLDRYKLTPHEGLVEQFVAYPEYTVCGRLDAVLEHADGSIVLVDLKTGVNAVKYPHATAAQFAMYANAPHVSQNAAIFKGDKCEITDWRTMPDEMDRHIGYVMLVEPDAKVGELYEINMEHGWYAAQRALEIIKWRKELNWGKDIAQLTTPDGWRRPTLLETVRRAGSRKQLNMLWRNAKDMGELTEEVKAAMHKRAKEIDGAA